MKTAIVAILAGSLLVASVAALADRALCYTVMEDLADSRRSSRMWSGWGIVAAGGLFAVGFAALEEPALGVVLGGLFGALGAAVLLIPSETEREFAALDALPASDQGTRCDVMLARLAESAKRLRYYYAIGEGAAAAGSLLLGSVTGFLTNLGGAAYYFIFPSDEEQAYQRYQDLLATSP